MEMFITFVAASGIILSQIVWVMAKSMYVSPRWVGVYMFYMATASWVQKESRNILEGPSDIYYH